MNKIFLMGRLTKDPEVRQASQTYIARFSIAVDRKYKKDGEPTADFLNCVAFGKTAEFVEKYFKKGMKIALEGRVQTGSYTNKEGVKVYTFDVVIESVEFAESKRASEEAPQDVPHIEDDWANLDDASYEDLPFH